MVLRHVMLGALHFAGSLASLVITAKKKDFEAFAWVFYSTEKTMVLVLLYEQHRRIDRLNAWGYELLVITACIPAWILAFWVPRVMDIVVLVYAAILAEKAEARRPDIDPRRLWYPVLSIMYAYVLGWAGLVHFTFTLVELEEFMILEYARQRAVQRREARIANPQ